MTATTMRTNPTTPPMTPPTTFTVFEVLSVDGAGVSVVDGAAVVIPLTDTVADAVGSAVGVGVGVGVDAGVLVPVDLGAGFWLWSSSLTQIVPSQRYPKGQH